MKTVQKSLVFLMKKREVLSGETVLHRIGPFRKNQRSHSNETPCIVVCETRLSIVDWVYSKTQILLATLRTQNQPRVESYVFSEVEHPFPSVGCARNKHQCHTVLQNQKLFRWMLV